MRTIYLNKPQPIKYMSNKISTAKYSVFLFIPKFLFEQFRRYANLFFLFIALLQQIPGVSPTGQFTTAIPLLMILSLSAVKEIFEDIKRRRADDETNSRKVYALRNNHWMEIEWRKIVVGDIVKVTNENFFPADLVLLSSSEPRGMCYIETSNLDGETNLKIRQGIPYTSNMVTHKDVESLNGILECELPNAHLYDFVGTLKPRASNPEESYSLGPEQMLLRGSMLRNTRWIFGVVIFTGHETKFMLNSTSIPLKRSTVEKVVNSQILMLFIILIVLALICAVANQVWISQNLTKHWYLGIQDASPTGFILNFLTFVILYNNLIPISLQVTLEIVRFIQAIFIQWDVEMYDAKHNIATVAKTSNLNEELGQVKYIFSDKTGTLTCNEMEFKKCSVGGVKYGDDSKSVDKFDDSSLMENFNTGHETAPIIRDFLTLLAVCHTVVPENDPKEAGGIKYLASSPDELALVLGARNQGFKFTTRTPTDVTIEVFDVKEKYKILNVLAFTSNRKRMSVIVRLPNGKIRLMIKGADMVIFPRLASQQQYLDVTINHLEEFASLGLRTLCLAVADIDEDKYEEWSKEYQVASTSIENRYEKLETAAELIEKDLQLLGATAIEDKLQEGVPDTIASLLKAEIKIWVLTGDKQETAINIGYACQLFTTGMKIIYFNETTLDDTAETLRRFLQELGGRVKQENNLLGLITDGETLKHAMSYRCREDFLSLLLSCKSVICCRMSPLQKAELVNLVKVEVKSITLAIGDGANDVGMIQASHVGVGISGREGLQAACASDYAIGQFRFLKRLLLIHGAWSYSRLTTLILYCFYKNICLYLIEFWFAIISAFSGQILFERWCIGLYNVIFTAATPMAIGLFDQHCSAENLLKYPVLYKFTQSSECFNVKVFWGWCINSIYHSVVFFWLAVAMLQHEIAFADGKVGNYLFLGNMVYTYVVVAVCIKGGLETSSWTWLTHLSIWGSIITWFLFLAIYPHFWPTVNLAPEMVGMDKYVYTCPLFWFGLFLIPCIVLFSDIIWKAFQRTFYKSVAQQVQEMEDLEHSPSTMSIRSFLTKSGRKTYMEDAMKDFPATEESVINQEPRGFAFSQEEHGVVEQDHLVRVYDSNMEKPSGL
ncbi:hypothetical protein HELRODRAFT_110679 [Helobdella robusta]|uniref:Phospholipid-transporting ATPase n=1 Tax=Helobdella robusta TaxID=6412 RepID=T1EF42_HELRO|nr:hypothetical protein HELRODRAFT_110679 [Helobdella robusta]ESO07180.1 hypothetical protein HELRODRAFT_110679 [Helobdella robusta]